MFFDLQKTQLKENIDQLKADLPAVKTKRRLVFEVTEKKVQLCSVIRES